MSKFGNIKLDEIGAKPQAEQTEPVVVEQAAAPQTETPTPQPQAVEDKNTPPAPEAKPVEQDKAVDGNWVDKLKEFTGGKVNDPEQLKDVLSKYEQYNSELQELKAKAQENPFANELVKSLNDLYAKGASPQQISQFIQLQSIDTQSVSPLEAAKLRLMYENGYSEQEAQTAIELKYELDPDEYDDRQIERANKKLELEAKEHRKFLDNLKVELSKTDDSKAQAQQEAQQNYLNALDQWVPSALNGMEELKIKVGDEENAPELSYKFDDEFRKVIPNMVKNYLASQGIEPTEKNRAYVTSFVKNAYLAQNGERIAKLSYNEGLQKGAELERLRVANADPRKEDVFIGNAPNDFRSWSRDYVSDTKPQVRIK